MVNYITQQGIAVLGGNSKVAIKNSMVNLIKAIKVIVQSQHTVNQKHLQNQPRTQRAGQDCTVNI